MFANRVPLKLSFFQTESEPVANVLHGNVYAIILGDQIVKFPNGNRVFILFEITNLECDERNDDVSLFLPARFG